MPPDAIPPDATTAPTPAPRDTREALRARAAEVAAKRTAARTAAVPDAPQPDAPAEEPRVPAAAQPAEEKKEPPADPPKPERPKSDEFAAIAREKAILKAQRDALTKQQADFDAAAKDRVAKETEAADDAELKKTDIYAWVEKHGGTLRGWNERALNKGNKTPEEVAREIASAEIAAFKKEAAEERAKEKQVREQEDGERRKSEAMQKWDSEIDATLSAPAGPGKTDEFVLVKSKAAEHLGGTRGLVKQVVMAEYQRAVKELIDGGMDAELAQRNASRLTTQEAAGKVEVYLGQLRDIFRELDKATVAAKQSAAQQAPKVTQGGTVQPPRTLDPTSPASPAPTTDEYAGLPREERKRLRKLSMLAKRG